MKAKHFILLAVLALTIFMFAACKNEPAVNPGDSATLTGVVFDAETTQPLQGALVSIGVASTTTDVSGGFAFYNVGEGTYNVSVSLAGYEARIIEGIVVEAARVVEEEESETLVYGNISIDPIALYPVYTPVPATGILYGNVGVKFIGCPDVYTVPAGTAIFAVQVDEDLEPVGVHRSEVGIEGAFLFEELDDGVYEIALEPFEIEYAGETVKFQYEELGLFPVIEGIGKTGDIFAYGEEVDLKIVSIKSIPRDQARDLDFTEANMTAGEMLRIEFNKNLDPEAEDTGFFFINDEHFEDMDYLEGVVGYTEYEIVDNVAYVWHDGIESVDQLYLFCAVASYEGDTLADIIEINYHNALKIVQTNLYVYAFNGAIMGSRIDPTDPVVLIFDEDLPASADVDTLLSAYDYDPETGDRVIDAMYDDLPYSVDGNVLRIYGPFAYGKEYELTLKIATSDGVVLFNSLNGMLEETIVNIIQTSESGTAILFNSMKFRALGKDEVGSMTNIVIDGDYLTNDMDIYEPVIFVEFNTDISDFYDFGEISATLLPVDPFMGIDYEAVDLDVALYSDTVVACTIPGEGKALWPMNSYAFVLVIDDELLFDNTPFFVDTLITYVIDPDAIDLELDPLFVNGLQTFDAEDEYDMLDSHVEFTWESGFYNSGEGGFYALLRKGIEDDNWELCNMFPEKGSFVEYYYDSTFIGEGWLEPYKDLAFGGYVDFVLLSFDNDGFMIQSPMVRIRDTVAPELLVEGAVIEEGEYEKGTCIPFTVRSIPMLLNEEPGEYLSLLSEDDVEIGGEYGDDFKVTWTQVPDDPDTITFIVEFLCDLDYEEGDLELTLFVSDTSGNVTETFIDFIDDEE